MHWTDLYPFDVQCESIRGMKMSFLDEFTGGRPLGTLLFVHGNPTWSFHWRNLVLALRDRYRCIAVDHLGCGFSERPPQPLRLADHIENLITLVDHLRPSDVTLVAQDWGGAIGLGAALARRSIFSRIVLFNTGAFRPWFIPWRIRVCRTPFLGQLAVQGANLFCRAALSMTLARKRRLDEPVAAGYLAPTATWDSRRAIYDFVEDIPMSPRHPTWSNLESIEARLGEFADVPILLVWGMRDWCFTPACLEKFREAWPHAEVRRLHDVGHWVVEDAPEEALAEVEGFLVEPAVPAGNDVASRDGVAPIGNPIGPPHCSPAGPVGPTVAQAAYLACALEATAPKPGNIYPGRAFADLSYEQMLQSAAAISPIVAEARHVGVGRTVLRGVQAMHAAANTNSHLGTILLLAPLACVDDGKSHRGHIQRILAELHEEDTRCVYEAIRLASPGGLGDSAEADVREEPPRLPLVDVMRIAADRDLVARQFVNGFHTVFNDVTTILMLLVDRAWQLPDAIVYAHVNLIARYGDSLIARKCGAAVSDEARERAVQVMDAVSSASFASPQAQAALADFDSWLSGNGNRRNPGTTADLIAAGLFVLLREERLPAGAAVQMVTGTASEQTRLR